MKPLSRILRLLVQPHPSITDVDDFRRAQLLAILSLLQLALIPFGLTIDAGVRPFLITYGIIAAISYILSRTKLYKGGAYLVAYFLVSFAYVRIFIGVDAVDSIATALTSVYIALAFASAILTSADYLFLVALTTLATFAIPYYSNLPPAKSDNPIGAGAIILAIGLILYAVNLFRMRVDERSIRDLLRTNSELTDIKENLENRVTERTDELQKTLRQLEERSTRLTAASEISQAISLDSDKDFNRRLGKIADVIAEKTGHYHVGIFIADQNAKFVALKAANQTSPGGQTMLARQHQLKIGGAGIVGYAAQSGQVRIALDTGADAVYFNNPDLPQTHSEIAFPLKAGTTVIGILDIQSQQVSAFDREDIVIFETLANQVSLIVQNSLAAGTDTREVSWEHNEKASGYSYLPDGSIGALTARQSATLAASGTLALSQPTSSSPSSLAVPVTLRDTVIGIIQIESAEGERKWSEDEIALTQAVSERAALALENARLFEEAEKNAEREKVISAITARIGESNKLEHILQSAIQELGRSLRASRTFIQIEPISSNAQNIEKQDEHE